jgi:plastocyanin
MQNRRQNLLIFLVAGVLLTVLLFAAFNSSISPSSSSEGSIHKIVLNENGFSPSEIIIKPGDSIEFTTSLNKPFWPASDLHPSHGIYPEFDPQQPVEPAESWTFKFQKSGRWKYHDHLQPQYRATIVVN